MYRAAAHAGCDLNCKQCKTIPVIFLNLKNYDPIMSKQTKFKDHEMDLIAFSMENYITFIKKACMSYTNCLYRFLLIFIYVIRKLR